MASHHSPSSHEEGLHDVNSCVASLGKRRLVDGPTLTYWWRKPCDSALHKACSPIRSKTVPTQGRLSAPGSSTPCLWTSLRAALAPHFNECVAAF